MVQSILTLGMMMKNRLWRLCHEEDGEVNIVTIVVLIGIAVLLALVFKEQVTNLITTLFRTITTNATNAVNNP